MASLQYSFFSSLSSSANTTLYLSFHPGKLRTHQFKSFSATQSNPESSQPISGNSPDTEQNPVKDPVNVAFDRAKAYKKSLQETDVKKVKESVGSDDGKKEVSLSVKIATEKAKEYKKSKEIVGNGQRGENDGNNSGFTKGNGGKNGNRLANEKTAKKGELTVSSIDFMGLNFADKRQTRGLPPGLLPTADPIMESEVSEVEFIVGDTSKFGNSEKSNLEVAQEDDSDVYKPKVSTWGLFPRPSNISKTYGGGRVIRPGEKLESAEETAAKEARTKELLAAYKKEIGLSIDPKIKIECEKALEDGDSLMEVGKLREALPYYEKVMDKLTFKSDLHGLAALQWSICQDSLRRSNEARLMYEKLQGHPNGQVSKKARQFMFSFQAMEMMKVTNSSFSFKNTGYQNYFEAFVEKKYDYTQEDTEVGGAQFNQALPYIVFLISPILIVLLVAAQKRI